VRLGTGGRARGPRVDGTPACGEDHGTWASLAHLVHGEAGVRHEACVGDGGVRDVHLVNMCHEVQRLRRDEAAQAEELDLWVEEGRQGPGPG
jgi:hypothetical protein